ncbi:MAG: hypothetical protein V1694_12105 [Candidatus Eisenbacteria bacterium]
MKRAISYGGWVSNMDLTSSTILLSILLMWGSASASYHDGGVIDDLFFYRQPSARAEAMGKGGVAMVDDPSASFYNPASLGRMRGISISGSYGSPLYWFEDTKYIFLGSGVRVGRYGTVGISSYRVDYGGFAEICSSGEEMEDFEVALETLSLATDRLYGLDIGMNVNRIRMLGTCLREDPTGYSADIGVSRDLLLQAGSRAEQSLTFASSLYNVTDSKIDFSGDSEELPVIVRLGTAYNLTWFSKSFLPAFKTAQGLIHIEYQDLLNSKYYGALRIGGELRLLEMLALRLGYYRESRNDNDDPENYKDALTDVTYGFGIEIPLEKMVAAKIPLRVKFDMTRLQQPGFRKGPNPWRDFSVYSLSARWGY